MNQVPLLPKISIVSLIFKIPITLSEVDGPLLTFKEFDVTVPLPIALGLDKFIFLIEETLSLNL